jgi:hypothetical protein
MRLGVGVGARPRECAFARVALLSQYAICMRRIVCGASDSTKFSDIISQKGRIFGGKKVTEHEKCFDFLYSFCLENLLF